MPSAAGSRALLLRGLDVLAPTKGGRNVFQPPSLQYRSQSRQRQRVWVRRKHSGSANWQEQAIGRLAPQADQFRSISRQAFPGRLRSIHCELLEHFVATERAQKYNAAAALKLRSTINRKTQEDQMAKGQARSNREVRKPKKEKTVTPVATAQGTQVKFANSALSLGKKQK
ncbi:hypothetical protein [Rhizobium sullae]|uniref:Uncharacterized protein n=1 Tax=Rhizobium sullae TaxID=50338 RepID=A0ABY5XXS8_RHISU|nr:hypothetical protein [Rhizobium sullae]UWU19081.1 hypothetical protein N2599_24280 [Rhizobium sullae]